MDGHTNKMKLASELGHGTESSKKSMGAAWNAREDYASDMEAGSSGGRPIAEAQRGISRHSLGHAVRSYVAFIERHVDPYGGRAIREGVPLSSVLSYVLLHFALLCFILFCAVYVVIKLLS
ncbi:hypothetical protein BV22DRAFT_33988 [Leucogyrophana mollusca]|uniref:Uncharacterized protein n=1 Tax=Leucogyrophana mollusca TaxID=85980 RepID=A0ACB8C0T4_9AGAM|nr:hypothetical protein BV22DRAFT_33988 [Leucogyrophana mollusca]